MMHKLIKRSTKVGLPPGELVFVGEQKDGKVMVHVQDTGVGISPEVMDKIFTPFFTTKEVAQTSDPSAIKGTGLGLYVCRQIMEHHHGEIQVQSRPGEGIQFTLIFNPLS